MIAEKLLLHILIIFAPVFLFSIMTDGCKIKKNNLVFTLLQCGAAFLSIAFSNYSHGLYWDLRFVPLVLTTLYAGPIPGSAVLFVILITRGFIGGDWAIYAYIGSMCVMIVPILFSRKFWMLKPERRVKFSILIGVCSTTAAFIAFVLFDGLVMGSFDTGHLYRELLIGALFHVLALAVAARLIEEIIERQQMREEIIRTEKLNTMADLAGSFAHEVRNPLTVVKGFIQLMHKEADGKDRDYLTLTLSEVGRAEMIISNYLSFAKPEFNKIEEFNYKKLLEEIIVLLEPLAAKEGVIIEGKLSVNELYYATDRSQVKQAIVNLVKNAIEATPQGGKVILSLDLEDGQARIGIRDNGRGMTEEQLSRIGTLFYTTKDRGTGLGTTVAIGIIQAMKGNIQFKSEEGRGTEVMLKLPVKKTVLVPETKRLSILKG
ncbi:hypothetical protein AM500_23725 [Bacillus sp. FJAT-18017]|uniref:ATP-binding protein n=1 Tax=Bacillus sp. FJAT-18017 TaxID=1705566 RepID=UPI0006B0470E|nr:ATP-binding protein [Bacillus sp. FJAT-18017]ALC92437.1 hypothetical protein AM500_23725 [Bacillus sp. FJAT-18017]